MQNLLNDLKTVLEKDDHLIAGGQLLRNKIIEMALAMDCRFLWLTCIKRHVLVRQENASCAD
jgi:hypothetical protein